MRELVYALGGWQEALPPRRIGEVRAEVLSERVGSEYLERRYPAVAIASASGALAHLCTALDMPWLPQTFLIPVRQSCVHPDEPKRSLEAGIEPGGACSRRIRSCSARMFRSNTGGKLPVSHLLRRYGRALRRSSLATPAGGIDPDQPT